MKKIMLLGSLLLFMVSCESDSIENTNQNVIGYKYTFKYDHTDLLAPDTENVSIGNLLNGKLYSETSEHFINGVSQGSPITTQYYFYYNNKLEHREFSNMHVYYYYDSNNNLIGATGVQPGSTPINPAAPIYERYIQQANNIVYCERINLPYNNPSAVPTVRYILQRNSDGEVVTAGPDHNLDGVTDYLYTYSYNNGNMVAVQNPDGTTVNYNYSNVVDTYSHLLELSCGKQVLQFPCATFYADGHSSILKYSKNITSEDLLLDNYQVIPSNFYFKKTFTENLQSPYQGTYTREMEYFFN